ncbi:MAG TPA: YiiX/YebB-like N1pC/P60 family cysteine hydrolase [Bacteroidales bacterium]|nr:YiiX/YebB-like N1pC/P60 family cysteine hydrolase [Bacteroidales bacterium]
MLKQFIILIFIVYTANIQCQQSYTPQTGELLFQDLDCGEFCDAIEKVTQGYGNKSFSHVGIAFIEDSSIFVIEAGSKGVVKTPFQTFINRSLDSLHRPKVIAGRLKHKYRYLTPSAISKSLNLLGKTYDDAFDITNDKYYCSELVYFAFMDKSGKSIFKLYPMTFIDPTNHKIFPAWERYFESLNIPFPEGKPGLNPGSISRCNKIKIMYSFY